MIGIDLWLTLGGLFAGTVVGLTGLGGAAIVTPMLLLLFNLPASVAVSTDVVSAAVTKPIGAMVHLRRRTPYLKVVAWLTAGSVPGVLVGTVLFARLTSDPAGEELLRRMIGVVLIVAVVISLVRLRLKRYMAQHSHDQIQMTSFRCSVTLTVGLLVGILVGLTSVGSGTLIAASLIILFPAMLPSRLVGTDLVQAVPMLVVGAIAHAGLGEVDASVLLSLLLGQIPGVWLGARVSARYNGNELRWLLLVLVAAGGIALLGAPRWIATAMTVIGCVGLGVPVVVKAVRERQERRAEAARKAAAKARRRASAKAAAKESPAQGSAGEDAT
ncbi:MAG: sulfite exporter TauE/SafE family protein [Candidatus Nanopelagicales bacterium]|nr:sulfite exporter TauE/SafE family protein [Candidatus Nanopelagicales bacterium]MDZ4249981.1 sulfite exporter TauE/SafE family protein [Candidatus Nanopelagicales bacterium]